MCCARKSCAATHTINFPQNTKTQTKDVINVNPTNTHMGRQFFENDIPKINKNLEAIAKELKRANDLKEQELKQKGVALNG